jgi:hypothetical protein
MVSPSRIWLASKKSEGLRWVPPPHAPNAVLAGWTGLYELRTACGRPHNAGYIARHPRPRYGVCYRLFALDE